MKGNPMQRNFGIGSPLHQDKVKTKAPDKKEFIESLGGLKDPDHVDLTRKPTVPTVDAPGGDPSYKPTLKTEEKKSKSKPIKPPKANRTKTEKVLNFIKKYDTQEAREYRAKQENKKIREKTDNLPLNKFKKYLGF